ncbi:peptidylprolyl isomerase [Wenzhouxiangella sp. EGI_FJ10305]|uniref:peptidylprolyl isomerase n=1 Tax=Wenzhouxiangella sp. EGI_FJ10305 TaxID=3243768 RepID=UPI0035DF51DA
MNFRLLIILAIVVLSACAQQEEGAIDSNEKSTVLVEVDGQPITLAMLERSMEARGVEASEHERMRELLDELIRVQAVANAARSEGMVEDPAVQAELRLVEIQTLYRHYIDRAERAEPVSDEDIRDVYQAQLARSGDTQYHIETIAYDEQARALQAIRRLEDGEVDYSGLRGEAQADGLAVEEPGWIDRSQVPEDFAARLVETESGAVVPRPLETGRGWHLVRVLETRDLQVPSLEQVREGIARSLLQQRREALTDSLYDQAEITPMLPLEEADPEAEE